MSTILFIIGISCLGIGAFSSIVQSILDGDFFLLHL